MAYTDGQKVPSMTEFIVPQTSNAAQNYSTPQDRIRRWVWKLCIATLILMAIGSATRVMNAGLACPDWPLCYGTLVPRAQMNLQVFLEWFHRLDAALIGVGALSLSVSFLVESPPIAQLATLGGYFCPRFNYISRRIRWLNSYAIITF